MSVRQVDTEIEDGETKSSDDLARCRGLLDEVLSHKANVEALSDRCETLMELSACPGVRDEAVWLQSAYTTLLTNVQG